MNGVDLDRQVDTRVGTDVDREAMILVCKRNAHRVGAPAAQRQLDFDVFRSDRRRQNFLQVRQNHLVLRYPAYDALRDPGAVADEVIDICRRRRHARRGVLCAAAICFLFIPRGIEG